MRRLGPRLLWIAWLSACRAPTPAVTPAIAPAPAPAPVAVEPAPAPVVVTPTPAPVEVPWTDDDLPRILAVQPIVHAAAAHYGVDARLINAVIWHESRFHANARGPGHAAGLMQLMPTTSKGLAKRMGRANRPYDPHFNVEAGALLLSRLLKIFDGDQRLALAGYGLGHVAVKRRVEAGEPLPERTERFVSRVESWMPAFATLPCPKGTKPGTACVERS